LLLLAAAVVGAFLFVGYLLRLDPIEPGPQAGPGTPQIGAPGPSTTSLENDPKHGQRILSEVGRLTIFGRVSASGGGAIARPDESAYLPEEAVLLRRRPTFMIYARKEAGGHRETASVDEQGNYTIGALTPGSWIVLANALGYVGAEQRITIDEKQLRWQIDFQLVPKAQVVVELVLRGARSIGSTPERDEALGLRLYSQADVLLARSQPTSSTPPFFPSGALQQERSFHTRAPRGADWILRERFEFAEDPPRFASLALGNRIVETKAVAGGDQPVVFELDAQAFAQGFASLDALVVDAVTRAPVPGAELRVRLPEAIAIDDDSEVQALENTLAHGVSDEHGKVAMPYLRPGHFEVEVYAPEHERRVVGAELRAGQVTDLGTLALDGPVLISGTLAIEGDESAALVVECVPQGTGSASGLSVVRAPRSDDGSFELRGVGRGRYLVRVGPTTGWAATPVEVDTSAGSQRDVRLRAQRGTDVTFELAGPLAGLDVSVQDERGRCLIENLQAVRSGRTQALLPGKYTVFARSGDVTVVEQRFEVGAQPATVRVTIP
jgi:hypothetical protein